MKTLVTHVRPHLDDICALWLLKRNLAEYKEAVLSFISADPKGVKLEEGPDTVHIGVGRGRYDEHKGDIGECATTLVFKDVAPKITDDVARAALERIVGWVRKEDLGQLATIPYREFAVPALLEGAYEPLNKNNDRLTEFGFGLLDALFAKQKSEVRLEREWENRREFDSRFGRAVALVTAERGADALAYGRGFPIIVIANPSGTYLTVRADAKSDIDLTSVAEAVRAEEPEVDWYLHHSKKMLISGGERAPAVSPRSKLSIEQIIAFLQ